MNHHMNPGAAEVAHLDELRRGPGQSGPFLSPDGRGPLKDRRCSVCHGTVEYRATHQDITLMADPPRQVERYTRHVRWQCTVHEHHTGTYTEPAAEIGPPS